MKVPALLLLFVIAASTGYSQFSFGPEFYYGYSKYKIPRDVNEEGVSYVNEFRPSFATGAFAEFRFTKWFSIQIDLMFNRIQSFQGLYYSVDTSVAPFPVSPEDGKMVIQYKSELTKKTNNFSIPLTFQFNAKCIDFNIGTQFSIMTGGSEYYYELDRRLPGIEYYYEGEVSGITKFDFALTSSLSYKIFGNLRLEARLNYGLRNLTVYPENYNKNVHSRQILLGLNYNFN